MNSGAGQVLAGNSIAGQMLTELETESLWLFLESAKFEEILFSFPAVVGTGKNDTF